MSAHSVTRAARPRPHPDAGRGTTSQIIATLELREDDWFLDVGCGTGDLVRAAALATDRGRSIGLDLAPDLIARARSLSRPFENVEFHHAVFPIHPFPHACFDVVFSQDLLDCVPNLEAVLGEMIGLVKPGGRVASVVHRFGEDDGSYEHPTVHGVHTNLLYEREWRAAFERAGLSSVDQQRVWNPLGEPGETGQLARGALYTVGYRALAA